MARLRLLFALCLIGVGTMFGALALSGYYSPNVPRSQISAATVSSGGVQFVRSQPRLRFVAAESPAAVAPAKPKVAKIPPREIKPKAKEKRPQQAAAIQWPWNLFGN